MNVHEIMTPRPECISPEATLQHAAERMKELDVGAVPVCENNRLVGMLTDRDIALRSVSQGYDTRKDNVRHAMTRQVVYCYDDQDVTEVADIMQRMQIRRVPVLDRDECLVGIVSLGDLAVEQGNDHLAGETLEAISEPASPTR